jgi:hypothetical protein
MSGAFSGDEVPFGVAADAFYQKRCGVRSLLRIIGGLAQPNRLPANQQTDAAPLWIQRNGNDAAAEPYVSIACPDCLRTFQQTIASWSFFPRRIIIASGPPSTPVRYDSNPVRVVAL